MSPVTVSAPSLFVMIFAVACLTSFLIVGVIGIRGINRISERLGMLGAHVDTLIRVQDATLQRMVVHEDHDVRTFTQHERRLVQLEVKAGIVEETVAEVRHDVVEMGGDLNRQR